MFEKLDEAATDAIAGARHECIRSHCTEVRPQHVLLAITRDADNAAARALASMNINATNVQSEMERAAGASNEVKPFSGAPVQYEDIVLAPESKKMMERAAQIRRFFGAQQVAPEHLLLALVDIKDEQAMRVLEELGANITFLKRQTMKLIAHRDSFSLNAPAAAATVVSGISDLVRQHLQSAEMLSNLARNADLPSPELPGRAEIVLMVFLAFLPDFLFTQVAYQRYLLEETLRLLSRRTGPLDKESVASIVSAAAQNLRLDVRSIIETLWTQEYRLLNQMPDEAEHEEIGSVIEDLWWTYSEEIALHEVFDEALDDYRRKHVLNLQKGKLEISQRLGKLKLRLEDTLKQCFLKRSMSA